MHQTIIETYSQVGKFSFENKMPFSLVVCGESFLVQTLPNRRPQELAHLCNKHNIYQVDYRLTSSSFCQFSYTV